MLGKTHRAFGLTASAIALAGIDKVTPIFHKASVMAASQEVAIAVVFTLIGSALPDIDQVFGKHHRGITHAVWIPFCMLGAALYYKTNTQVFLALLGLFLGYMSHLFGDAFSKAGIAWLYPFQRYERLASGAFYVKGPRGPFIPVYEVGNQAFRFMTWIWRGTAAIGLVYLIISVLGG